LSDLSFEKTKILQEPTVLLKLKNQVDGIGFTCWAKQKRSIYKKNWIFQISALYSEWYPNKITAAECWDIEHSRRCTLPADDFKYDKKLKCKPEGCSIWDIPEPKFSIGQENILHSFD